jgi:hypothetical protein
MQAMQGTVTFFVRHTIPARRVPSRGTLLLRNSDSNLSESIRSNPNLVKAKHFFALPGLQVAPTAANTNKNFLTPYDPHRCHPFPFPIREIREIRGHFVQL